RRSQPPMPPQVPPVAGAGTWLCSLPNAARWPAMTPEQHAQVEALFADLAELPAAQANTELLRRCPDDAEVRAAVQRLLTSDAGHTSLSHRIAASAAGALADQTDPDLGASIGPYKLKAILGEGGFGVVYLAEQITPVHRQVALKIIKPGMGSRAVIARFEQE